MDAVSWWVVLLGLAWYGRGQAVKSSAGVSKESLPKASNEHRYR